MLSFYLPFIYILLFNYYYYYRYEYLWADGKKFKKPIPLAAPRYVALLMDWIEEQINNEEIFPVKTGKCIYHLPKRLITATTCGFTGVQSGLHLIFLLVTFFLKAAIQ